MQKYFFYCSVTQIYINPEKHEETIKMSFINVPTYDDVVMPTGPDQFTRYGLL